MRSTPNFTLPQGATITLPTGHAFYVLATIITVGTLSCFGLILAAIIGVSYLLMLAVDALHELVTHISMVYSQADSLSKIIVWFLVVFLLGKLSPVMVRSLRATLTQVQGGA